jgi:hypothetical protein
MDQQTICPDMDRLALYYGPSANFMQQKSTNKKDQMKDMQ